MNAELEKLAEGSPDMGIRNRLVAAYNLGLEKAVRIAESYRRENAYNCSHVFEIARVIREEKE